MHSRIKPAVTSNLLGNGNQWHSSNNLVWVKTSLEKTQVMPNIWDLGVTCQTKDTKAFTTSIFACYVSFKIE